MPLVVLSGPSTAGKTKISNCLIEQFPEKYIKIRSVTTRKHRKGEQYSSHYRFYSKAQFENAKSDFWFWKKSPYGFYGILKSDFMDGMAEEKIAILDIDVDCYFFLKKEYQDVISCFILPPDLSTLKLRIQNRGKDRGIESENDYLTRFNFSIEAIKNCGSYNFLLVNQNDEKTAIEIDQIVNVWNLYHNKYKILNDFYQMLYPLENTL